MENLTRIQTLHKEPLIPNRYIESILLSMSRWGDQEYAQGLEDGKRSREARSPSFIQTLFNTSKQIKDNRSQYKVLASLVEEAGEVALEVKIANGDSYKTEGLDGIIGECIDVIACALDLIWITNPQIKEVDLQNLLENKCNKWLVKTTSTK